MHGTTNIKYEIYRTLFVQKYKIILTEVLAGLENFLFLQGKLWIQEQV